MISIIKKIIVVVLVVILLDRLLAFAFMNIFFKHTYSGESGGTINYVITKKKQLDFLVLGPSRAKHSINPSQLTSLGQNGHNLGINATTILNSMLILDILLQNDVEVKTIVLQTDLENYIKGSDKIMLDQIKRLYPYDTALVRKYVREAGLIERIVYSSDLYKLNRKMLNVGFNFLKRNKVGDYNGYVGLPSIEHAPSETPLATEYVFDENTINYQAFKRLVAMTKENNIQLVVVFPPSYKNVFFNQEEQKKLVSAIQKEGVEMIVDMSDGAKYPMLEGVENWRDALHFNDKGARKFSQLLNGEIRKVVR